LFATRFSGQRNARVPELRSVRNAIRATSGAVLIFAGHAPKDDAFADLGFARAEGSSEDLLVVARGIRAEATCRNI
jgi:hypothetical protein